MITKYEKDTVTIVKLRHVIPTDLGIFYRHQVDEDAAKMAGFASRSEEAHMDHWHKIMANAENILRTVEVDGEVAGNMVSFMMEGVREVGYWIGREYWGKGVATMALAAFLVEVTTRPLYAHVALTNPGSMRVLQKCGFSLQDEGETEVIYRLD